MKTTCRIYSEPNSWSLRFQPSVKIFCSGFWRPTNHITVKPSRDETDSKNHLPPLLTPPFPLIKSSTNHNQCYSWNIFITNTETLKLENTRMTSKIKTQRWNLYKDFQGTLNLQKIHFINEVLSLILSFAYILRDSSLETIKTHRSLYLHEAHKFTTKTQPSNNYY